MKSNSFKKVLVLVLALVLVFTIVACKKDEPPVVTPGEDVIPPVTNSVTASKFFEELWASANKIGTDTVNPELNYGFELGLVLEVAIGEEVLPIDIDLQLFIDVQTQGQKTAAKIDLGLSFLNATIYYFMDDPDYIYGQFGSDTNLYKLPVTINPDETVDFEGNAGFDTLVYDLLQKDVIGNKSISDILVILANSFGPKDGVPYTLDSTINAILNAVGLNLYELSQDESIGGIFSQLGLTFSESGELALLDALKTISTTLALSGGTKNAEGTIYTLPLGGNLFNNIAKNVVIGLLADAGMGDLFTRESDIILAFERADNTSGSDIKNFSIKIATPEFCGSEKDLAITIKIDKLKFKNVTEENKAYLGATATAKNLQANLDGTAVIDTGLLLLDLPAQTYSADPTLTTAAYDNLEVGGTHTLAVDLALDLSANAAIGGNVLIANLAFADGSSIAVNFAPKAEDLNKANSYITITLANAGTGTAARALAQNVAMALANWFIKEDCKIMVDGSDISDTLALQVATFAASTTENTIAITYSINLQTIISDLILGLFNKTKVEISSAIYSNAASGDYTGAISFKVTANNTVDMTTAPVVKVDGNTVAGTDGTWTVGANTSGEGTSHDGTYTLSKTYLNSLALGGHGVEVVFNGKSYTEDLFFMIVSVADYATEDVPSTIAANTETFSKYVGGANNKDIVITVTTKAAGTTVTYVNTTYVDGGQYGAMANDKAGETVTAKTFTFAKADLAAMVDGKYNFNFITSIGEVISIEIEVTKSNIVFSINGLFNFLINDITSSETEFTIASEDLYDDLVLLLGANFMGDTTVIDAGMAQYVDSTSAIGQTVKGLLDGASGSIKLEPVAGGVFKATVTYTKAGKTATISFTLTTSERTAA